MNQPPVAPRRIHRCALSSLVFALLLSGAAAARAEVRLPALFSDHMVLQAGLAAPVWGWAAPGEKVRVAIADQSHTVTTGADGRWRVKLKPLAAAAAPLTLTVSASNTLTVRDVLVGEVWLGSGQSNMEWPVNKAKDFPAEQAAAEFPRLRMFTVEKRATTSAPEDVKGRWEVCSSNTVGKFSATLYFFGREVHQTLQQPVGLIHSSWGGTPIQAWTSLEAQRAEPALRHLPEGFAKALSVPFDAAKADADHAKALAKWKTDVAQAKAAGKEPPREPRKTLDPRVSQNSPANLFNGMIAPLVGYGLRGAIWYQGEANAAPDRAPLYHTQLATLIRDWRQRWGQGDFAFGWAQLPNYMARQTDPNAVSGWALVREGMLQTLALPNTGMGINIDIGEEKDIHPKNKQDVGHRLALWALAEQYHRQVPASGPLYRSHAVRGGEVEIQFRHTHDGLTARGGELKGFALAGDDRRWHWAKARIEKDRVVVSSPEVPAPVAVRYAWADNPDCNLYNGAGLPASPFRTDDWK